MRCAVSRTAGTLAVSNALSPLKLAVAFLAAFLLAVLINAAGGQSAWAFTLNPNNSSAEANHGFTWILRSNGNLQIALPEDDVYRASFSGEPDDTLTVPEAVYDDGELVTVRQVSKRTAGCADSMSLVTAIEYPKTVTSMTLWTFLPMFTSLTDFRFYGDGEIELQQAGSRIAPQAGAVFFPSTLERFNAGEVNGEYFDVIIPASLNAVDERFFRGISAESIYIPDTCTHIAGYDAAYGQSGAAFGDSPSIKRVVNDSDIWAIFPGCPNIETLEMNGSYGTELPDGAYTGQTQLTHVTIPEGITSIGASAFAGCTSLESVTWAGTELLIDRSAFAGTSSLKTLVIPDSVHEIGPGAFANSAIEAIVLPANLYTNYILDDEEITFPPDRFSDELLYPSTGAPAYSVPLFLSSSLDNVNTTLKSVDLMSYQQSFLPTFMFAGCQGLEEIAIPRTVATIMGGAFYNCTNLKNVYYYGDPTAISIQNTENKKAGLGYDYVGVGSFSISDETAELGFSNMQGMTFYGMSLVDGNALRTYAEENGGTYVPFAFIGDGGSSGDVQAKFGATMPENPVSIASFVAGGTPVIQVSYPYDEGVSRTLVPGEDCTVVYTDAAGNEVTSFDKAGAYTATITGDNKSVWGTTQVSFSVAAAPTVDIPVADGQNTGITAEGALVTEDGAKVVLDVDPVTSGEAYDALVAAMGDGTLAGVYDVALLVNGQPVHDGFGTITLTFPVDPQWNGYNVTVWHRHADGSITSETVVAADGKVSVTVTDLSTFALEVGQKAQQDVVPPQNQNQQQVNASGNGQALTTLPDTGDDLPIAPVVALAGAAVCALGATTLAGRRGRNRR